MNKSDPITKHAMKLANKQRNKALRSAFKTIDEFAKPSLDPEDFNNYEGVKLRLLNRYK